MSSRFAPAPVLGAALALACSAGCGGAGPGAEPRRLIALADEMAIESSFDPRPDAAVPPALDATVLHAGPLDAAPPEDRFRHVASWVRPVVANGESGGEAWLVEAARFELEPGRRVRVRASAPAVAAPDASTGGELEPPFALELTFSPSADELQDPAWAEQVFRQIGTFRRTLRRVDGPGGEVAFETAFEPARGTRELLICRLADSPDRPAPTFELRRFTERGGWLDASRVDGRSPWIRSVTALRDTREALVLGGRSELRCELDIPHGRPRLTAGLTALFGASDERIAIRVAVHGAGGRVERSLELPAGVRRWTPLELALDDLAGQPATLELSIRGDPQSAALVALGAPILASADPRELLDVVVISLDTLRADRSSAYGYDAETTPTLARLARESVVFENAITTAPWTLPAHISIFSGQYPDRHGVHGQHSHLAPETPWTPEEFQRAGYRTLAFTGSGYVNPEFGFARGFDRYAFTDPSYPPTGWLRRRRELGLAPGPKDVRPPATRTELLELLREPRRAPRFVFVHTYAAHNYAAGPDDLLTLGAERAQLDDLVAGVDPNALNKRLESEPDEAEAARLRERARFLYDASLRVADRLVGDVLDALEAADRLEHTLLIVLSDHGEELFERGRIGHGGSVFEEMIRVPLMIRAPGQRPARVPDVVSLVDVAPTLRELCGLRPPGPDGFEDGRSLVPLLSGAALGERPVLARGDRRDLVFRCLRGPGFKYVQEERPTEDPESRLFLLADDPGELADRAGEREETVAELRGSLTDTVEALEALGPSGIRADLSGDVLEKLRELGYLGED